MLSACSGFEIKSLGQVLYEQDVVISVVEAGGRNGQLYSRQLRSRLQNDGASATHSVNTKLDILSSSTFRCGICFKSEKEDDDSLNCSG